MAIDVFNQAETKGPLIPGHLLRNDKLRDRTPRPNSARAKYTQSSSTVSVGELAWPWGKHH